MVSIASNCPCHGLDFASVSSQRSIPGGQRRRSPLVRDCKSRGSTPDVLDPADSIWAMIFFAFTGVRAADSGLRRVRRPA